VFEYLPITERVQELLLHKAPVQKIRTQARKEGMRTLVENGMLKVERGLTTYEEILSISSGRTGI
jgi:type II secretory ATPase GspE/PulE/Tfp pilus assembly ATPase PilB-like protein